MIVEKDIVRTKVICEAVNFSIDRNKAKQGAKIDLNIQVNWGVFALRQDRKGTKTKVKYNLKSPIIMGEIELIVITQFAREINQEEIVVKESQKLLARYSINYIVQWIADITSKMGIAPIIISPQVIQGLIGTAK